MPNLALVAALEREIALLVKNWARTTRDYQGRTFTFFERDEMVLVCGGIGLEAARRASEAVIALYRPTLLYSVGFAGALDASLHVGDIFSPAVVIDARDGSRMSLQGTRIGAGDGALLTFMAVADAKQKAKLAQAYGARAVDMEAAAVAAAARAHGITFGATKVISDGLEFEMPGMARFINSNGQFRTASFVLFAASRPWLWKGVAALASNSRQAAQALSSHLERFCSDMANATNPASDSPGPIVLPSALHTGGRE